MDKIRNKDSSNCQSQQDYLTEAGLKVAVQVVPSKSLSAEILTLLLL
jgi:hypothetical protein